MTETQKFDPTRFAVSEATDVGSVGVERRLSVQVRKPNKQEFFRAHPSMQLTAPIIELKEERQFFILTPDVAAALPGDYALRCLSLCVNRQGDLFLWPLPVIAADGRAPMRWHESAIFAHKQSTEKWTRMVANMSSGEYDIYRADLDFEPSWRGLEGDMERVLSVAFGDQCLIESTDHQVVKMLEGRA